MIIKKDKTYVNKETGEEVLVMMIDTFYVYYQHGKGNEKYIKPMLKYEFLEQFEESK